MNDKQKIEDLFHNQARVLAMAESAATRLRALQGEQSSFFETLLEFQLAFSSCTSGIEMKGVKVTSTGFENTQIADRQAIEYIFCSNRRLRKLAKLALAEWNQSVRATNFRETVVDYTSCFTTLASEEVASRLWGIDLGHHRVRVGRRMSPYEMQNVMEKNSLYKKLDRHVSELFDVLRTGNIGQAYAKFQKIEKMQLGYPPIAGRRQFQDYLIKLSAALHGSDNFGLIIDDFENWVWKDKTFKSLSGNLPAGRASLPAKI